MQLSARNQLPGTVTAVKEGAVQRIRPKVMTVCAILFGLLPIMWSPATQAGADVMKRIATPMIGGVVTSAILELLIYPVLYVIWRKRALPRGGAPALEAPAGRARKRRRVGVKAVLGALLVGLTLALAYFGAAPLGQLWQTWNARRAAQGALPSGPPLAQRTVGPLTVSAFGALRGGSSEVWVEFKDGEGQPKEVGTVRAELSMNMPGMVMRAGGDVQKTGTPGLYRAKLQPLMGGDWVLRVSWDGPAGPGQADLPVNVAP